MYYIKIDTHKFNVKKEISVLNSQFRIIDGVILIDKPYGFSSNNVVQKVKKILKIKKIGHTGSLDPLATGMLPICCGKATKFSQFLIDADKQYHVIAKLGQKTSTSDSEGKIIKVRPINFTDLELIKTLKKFQGRIKQIPSMYSAIKYRGRALYKYARKGISVFRKSRNVVIHKLQLLGYTNKFLELDVVCSKGTYIRTLIEDIGENLKCGAHVTSLRRLRIGCHSYVKMIDIKVLHELEKVNINLVQNILISINDSISFFSEINLVLKTILFLKNKKKIIINNNLQNQFVRITEGKERRFWGIGRINNKNELFSYCWLRN